MTKTLLAGRGQQKSKRLIQYLLLLSSFIDDATNNVSTTTDATTAEYNGMALAIILGGLMGFLVLIIATVTLGTCVICICLRVCKCRRKCKKTGEIYNYTFIQYLCIYMIDQCTSCPQNVIIIIINNNYYV